MMLIYSARFLSEKCDLTLLLHYVLPVTVPKYGLCKRNSRILSGNGIRSQGLNRLHCQTDVFSADSRIAHWLSVQNRADKEKNAVIRYLCPVNAGK